MLYGLIQIFSIWPGWITDVTGNYDLAFYLAGFFISMSGILMLILPAYNGYNKYRDASKRKAEGKPSNSEDWEQKKTTTPLTNNTLKVSFCVFYYQLFRCFDAFEPNDRLIKQSVQFSKIQTRL